MAHRDHKNPDSPLFSPDPPLFGLNVTFHINYRASFGQSLCIAGSPAALGEWNTRNAVNMLWKPNDLWEVTIFMPFTKEGTLEYKYFVKSGDAAAYEYGKNRKLRYNPALYDSMVVEDAWRPSGEPHNALLSSAFTKVIFRRSKQDAAPQAAVPCGGAVIRFSLTAPRIDALHSMCIVGSHLALGAWDKTKAIRMSDVTFPVWSAEVPLPPSADEKSETVSYKYGIMNSATGKVETLEEGADRVLTVFGRAKHMHHHTDESFNYPVGEWKGAGVALPVFSLRSDNDAGVGEFLDLLPFIDWASANRLSLLQILPINDTVARHSWTDSYPYAAISVHALHPIYVNMKAVGTLKDAALQKEIDTKAKELNAKPRVDYEAVMNLKSRFYKAIYDQEGEAFLASPEFAAFFAENRRWLVPYAAFSCLRDRFGTEDYHWWPHYSHYDDREIDDFCAPSQPQYDDIAVHYFIQYHLHKQLLKVAEYARTHRVVLKGDLPIGVYRNSVDTWTEPHYFNMQYQIGAPPDPFSKEGQNWGFPTYNWERMQEDGYVWWQRRLKSMEQYFDAFRIDHILGFFRIWQNPFDAITGLLGQFHPMVPLSLGELAQKGINMDYERFCTPYIREHFLADFVGAANVAMVKQNYLAEYQPGCFRLKVGFNTQRQIEAHFTLLKRNATKAEQEKLTWLAAGLMALAAEVIFMPVAGSHGDLFTLRYSVTETRSFSELDGGLQYNIRALYTHFVYHRHDGLWADKARAKLPAIKASTDMLICGEDLGDRVPACVAAQMRELEILSLNIQRMPKDPKREFFHPGDAAYLSVVSTSSHDMPPLRAWWEEDFERARRFYNTVIGRLGDPDYFCNASIVRDIINQHLHSPAMWAIFPLQDLVALDEEKRLRDPLQEQINVPANSKHYWRWRFHMTTKELQGAARLNTTIRQLLVDAGRGCPF
eukprot:TRINITY_DN1975_c1_g1_i1.p1 TRINITY_DN1975_c1_g1~~TRINITY_DN1975_c1_g1_i1.p1  ORF type:complete len:957 (-),score=278.96 TRINITY_DN1975_c1_g1_i1:62-2878(-)